MFQAGRRLFSFASIGLILTGVLHMLGQFAPSPPDPGRDALEAAMASHQIPIWGMTTTTASIFASLSLTMSVMLLWLGLTNLIVARSEAGNPVIRRLMIVNVVGAGALVTLFACYRIFPPLLCLALVEVVLLMGLFARRPRRSVAASKAA